MSQHLGELASTQVGKGGANNELGRVTLSASSRALLL